jgi:hypothetical protein
VDRSSAVRQLPELLAVAIRLRDMGHDDHVIAVALEIDDEQVPTVLHLAERKLRSLLDLELASPPRVGPHDRP